MDFIFMLAAELEVDFLLGGTWISETLEVVAGTRIQYLPFVGIPQGHPTILRGNALTVGEGCRQAAAAGCAGVDLLAYRAVDAKPLELIEAARIALDGRLIVAGSITSVDQVTALAAHRADGFTIGSAVFSGLIDESAGLLEQQLRGVNAMVLEARARLL